MRFILTFAAFWFLHQWTGSLVWAFVGSMALNLFFVRTTPVRRFSPASGSGPAAGSIDDFGTNLFTLLGHLAKVDGRVDRAEIDVVEQLIEAFGLVGRQREVAIESFTRGKSIDDPAALIERLASNVRGDENMKTILMRIVTEITNADGQVSGPEAEVLRRLHEAIGSAAFDLDEAIGTVAGDDPHEVLELERPAGGTADRAAIKKAYRKKCLQYHPDHIAGKNLPPEMRAFAEAQMRKIQAAYEKLMETAT